MFKVENNEITLTRGDTFRAEVSIKQDGAAYTPQEGDTVRFYLKRDVMNVRHSEYADKKPLLTKVIPNDTLILSIEADDTKELGFGEYVYDIEIEFANGDVDTFINRKRFILVGEVG